MKNIFFIIAIQFLTLNTVSANEAFEAANKEVVFFDGTILTIPAISLEKQEGAYQEVKFKLLPDGKWELLDYKTRGMVGGITDVNIVLTETFPVQGFLEVSGTHMSGCGSIEKVRHQLVGNTFIVSVDDIPYPSKPLTEDDIPMCTMALVDFSKTISLPLYGLKDGEYKYIVNDEFSGVFNVSNDNLSSDKQLVSFPDDDAIFDEMDDWRTEN